MELKDQKKYYLHPDFEEIDINLIKNKPSPLALLAQTCKNIGSTMENKESEKAITSTIINGFKKITKRCRSDCSSNGSSIEKDSVHSTKRIKVEKKIFKTVQSELVEVKNSNASSENSCDPSDSVISNLLSILKSSNNSELTDSNKIDLLQFLVEHSNDNNVSRLTNVNKGNQFSIANGYHLESSQAIADKNNFLKSNKLSPIVEDSRRRLENEGASEQFSDRSSSIKYCMYCGQLIPVLPMLLAHIRLAHNGTNRTTLGSFNATNMFDTIARINPCLTTTPIKSNPSLSFLSDYMNSQFSVLSNLIC